jgi:hypothetical protein
MSPETQSRRISRSERYKRRINGLRADLSAQKQFATVLLRIISHISPDSDAGTVPGKSPRTSNPA